MRLGLRSLQIVVGLESVRGPSELVEIVEHVDSDRLSFSLDMDDGRPRTSLGSTWPSEKPFDIASRLVELGVRRLILLDLSRVGTDRGVGTERLLARIRSRCDGVDVTVGGGVRGIDDLVTLKEQGASNVLVGSAIHDGRIGRGELERIRR